MKGYLDLATALFALVAEHPLTGPGDNPEDRPSDSLGAGSGRSSGRIGIAKPSLRSVYGFVIASALPPCRDPHRDFSRRLCRACRLSDARPLGASTEPRGRLFYLAGPRKALKRLEAVREPSESYSDAILRLAEMETTDQ